VDSSRICRSVLDGMTDAAFIFDSENRLLYMNLAAEALTGLKLSDSLGSSYDDIFAGLGSGSSLNDALKQKGQPSQGNFEHGDKAFWFSASPLSEDGEFSGTVIFLRNPSDEAGVDSFSCNDAEQELKRRDRILAGVVLAINQLLIVGEKDTAINQALEILGCSADVDRVYILESITAENGERMHGLRYEWARDNIEPRMKNAQLCQISSESLPQWHDALSSGRPVRGITRDLPAEARELLRQLRILSYLVVPVFMEGSLWGLIGFDDCRSERKWTWCEVSVLLTMAGALGGSLGRWKADEELRESEEKYRELVENSNSIIMRRDASGKITFFNEFAQEFFGYSLEEILGRNVVGTIVPPVDSSGQDLRRMIEDIGKRPERYASNVNENMRSNGERVWVAWTNRPLLNEQGDVIELLCIGNDITERKLAEEKLKAAHEHLLEIIEFLPDATFVIDGKKKVIAWNRAIEEMTGVSKDEVLGRGDYIYGLPFYGQPQPMLIDLIDAKPEEVNSNYFYVEKKDGKLYAEAFVPSLFGGRGAYVWVTASPLYDCQGNLIGAIESIRDVTELKEASEELRKRDVLLAGIAAAANALLVTRDFETEINQALEILGLSAGMDRVYIYQNHMSPNGERLASRKYEWCREGSSRMDDPALQSCPYEKYFPRWYAVLSEGDVISGLVRDFPPSERAIEHQDTLSLIAIPINIKGEYWGFIGFDDCRFERIWSKTEISILRSAAGSIGATIERKLAEAELRETRDYLENLIGYANAPIIVWDPSFRITRFNHAFERLTGLSLSDVLGKPLDMLFPEESRSESLAYIQRTLSGERWDAVEIPILRKDGAVRTVLWNSATLYDKDGSTVVATIAQGQDITERNQAQEQVNYQASLLDQVRNAVVATDLTGKIVYWNKFAEVLHQWSAEEIIGKSILGTIVPEEGRDRMREVMKEITRAGYSEGEFLVKRKDASTFPAFYVFNVLKDIHGQDIGFVGVSIDIAERKRVEADLRKSKEKAESATRAKSQFLANMSHEIRTPMNAIIGLTGLLLNTELTPEQRDYAETIRGSGDTLLAVINDILDFSKIDEGKMEIERQPFDLVDCIESSLDLVTQAAVRKGLSLSYSIDSQVPQRVLGDMTRLRQVLVNLLSNAVKFTEHGDVSVAVSGQSAGSSYEITFSVSDTGIGISRDRMDRLFQTFSQVDASMTRKYGGTGLGLAISRKLVELMGGHIWAESVPGSGSAFYFTITAEAVPGPSIAGLAGKKVLVISERMELRDALCSQLSSWLMKPQTAPSCKAALDKIADEMFDLAILDLDVEGFRHFMEAVHSIGALPVVALGSPDGAVASFAAVVPRPVRPSSMADALFRAARGMPVQRAVPAQEAMPVQPDLSGRVKPARILLAEDNAINQKVAMRMLDRLGYQAEAVANGLEVLQALERQPYDIVLMDVQMPEMDGLEAARRIREMPAARQPYIIAMTAHAMKGDREECMAAGMDDYISKPVRMEELQTALVRSSEHGKEASALDQQALDELRKLQMDGEPDIVQELGGMFLDRAPARINAMKDALARGDAGSLKREAHNLKSSSANLGALRLSGLCKDLEILGRSGELQGAQELMEKAEAEFERVRTALESEISSQPAKLSKSSQE
jgi:PAS domain S-box-containing protein